MIEYTAQYGVLFVSKLQGLLKLIRPDLTNNAWFIK